ncbi:MAG: C-type lectin domain-containing protein [Kofleriaceae bacterium]
MVNPFAETASFAKAQARCAADGAHLLITETLAEADALWDHIEAEVPGDPHTNDDTGYYRVGVARASVNAMWIDVLGRPFEPPAWGPGQPDDGPSNSECLLLGEGGEHWDWNCDADQEFACECE